MNKSHVSPTTGDFTLDAAARRELLDSHNELRTALQTILECNDMWMSDVGKLESLMYRMQSHLNFERKTDVGTGDYGSFVLAEENEPAPKKHGRLKKNDG